MNISISVLVRGATGILRPLDTSVIATFQSNSFTRFDFASGVTSFTLVAFQVDFVSITNFQLQVSEICSNGEALSVHVEYFTETQVVSETSPHTLLLFLLPKIMLIMYGVINTCVFSADCQGLLL